jgi:hypothetical protein
MKRQRIIRKQNIVRIHFVLAFRLIALCTLSVLPASGDDYLRITDFKSTTVSCDYLIIAPSAFIDCALRLAAYRNSCQSDDVEQAKVVELQAVYDSFPVADTKPVSHRIWYGLKYAKTNWSKAPDYVVLLGDDSLSYKGRDSIHRNAGIMPTFFWQADTGRTSSGILDTNAFYADVFYATIGATSPPSDPYNQFTAPSMSIGRIPARTAEECSLYIDKVISFETVDTKGAWYNSVIGSADDMFENGKSDVLGSSQMRSAERTANDVLRGFFTTEILLSSYAKDADSSYSAAKRAFFDAVNNGARWSYYFGRGNRDVLSGEGFLDAADSSLFENDSVPTMFFAFTSRNGDFLRKPRRQMCISYLLQRTGGCIAYVAAGVPTSAAVNEYFAQDIFSTKPSNGPISLGKALANAQQSDFYEKVYQLLGDPALVFVKKTFPIPTEISKSPGSGIKISSSAQLDGGAPLSYTYRVSIRDSMRCIDDSTVKYLRDSVVVTEQGAVSGPITCDITEKYDGKKIKYALFIWNDEYEARYDTVFIPQSSAVRQRSVEHAGQYSPHVQHGLLTVSSPLLTSREGITISLFDLKGSLIRSMKLSPIGVLDLKTLHISEGNYLIRLQAGSTGYCRKIHYLR